MIRLRKILLCNYFYYFILIVVSIITFYRININYTSKYNITDNKFTGKLISYSIDGNKLSITISSDEKIIGNYYFKDKNSKKYFINNFNLGDMIQIKGNLLVPRQNTTEGLFNYKNYLKYQQIYYTIKIDDITLIEKNNNIFYKIYEFIYNSCTNPYLKTFILGDTSVIDSDVVDSYRGLGISHLFAISGMHISLISSILLKILKKIKLSEVKRYLIVGIFLLGYLFLTGISPSVLRAVLFFILFSINSIYYLYIKNINIFILAISISLLINPFYIYDVGFLYSFSISFSLLILSNLINRYNNYFSKLFMTSLISFIVSIPITIYNFNQLNILSIFYNLFFVPFISIIVFPLALLTFFIRPLEIIFNIFIDILETFSLILSKINFSKLIFCNVSFFIIIIYIIFIIIFFLAFSYKNKLFLLPLLMLLLVHFLIPNFDNRDYLEMIDVGQGDSFLLHSDGKTMLIDTGGVMDYSTLNWQKRKRKYSIVKNITIPLLKKQGITQIDYLILTHGDYDHLGEARILLDNFKVKNVLLNEGSFNYLEKVIINKYHNVGVAFNGYSFQVGEFSCLSINKDLGEENDSSLVLYITIHNKKLMFMGDASIKSEESILNEYSLEKIDILKLGHHGSRTSSSESFLETVFPKIALVSAGVNNKFNHPHKDVVERVEKMHIKILSTIKSGTIKIYL